MAPDLRSKPVIIDEYPRKRSHEHYSDIVSSQIPSDQNLPKSETKRLREKHVGPNVQLFFEEDPLKIVRGYGQYLYDENNQKYLDCNSNVNHVGHSHSKVAEAVFKQMMTLNVNSRFLNDKQSVYAERLTSKFPGDLDVCYFGNSGSEVNDLALQIARAYHKGQRQHIICMEQGYHGHLEATMKISDYKKKDGKLPYGFADLGENEWAKFISLPDPVRGKFAYLKDEQQQCDAYIKELSDLIESERDENGNCMVAAILIESIPSCAGQVVFPQNYLKRVYELMRREDILCIADEVQTGFGRVGSKFWAFELFDVIPDMVTVGKPIANGYPLSALVTTPVIAQAFCAGKRTYFNTYGGAPASMAAGLAVLEVIESEKLQENALRVGAYLKERLDELKSKHWMISSVRGIGLFVGFELVNDVETKTPATKETALLQMRLMKEDRVLINTDGKYDNVVKFKPPMCFTKQDCDLAFKAIDRVLYEIEQDLRNTKTDDTSSTTTV